MTREQIILLDLLSKVLFDRPINHNFDDCDWKAVYEESKEQAVTSLCYRALYNHLSIPSEINGAWRKDSLRSISGNMVVTHNHALLHKWMTEADIPYVILKGVASAHYYPSPEYRAMGDVDFLVPKDQVEKAGEILKEHGLTPSETGHGFHIAYHKSGMSMELHFDVSDIPDNGYGALLHGYLQNIYEESSICNTSYGSIIVPSLFHHGLIMLLHTSRHMLGSGIGLRHLCDWAVFASSLSNEEFIEIFEKKLKAVGLWRYAQYLTQVCIKYLGMDDREWARENYAVLSEDLISVSTGTDIADDLIEDIFSSGNFGRKDTLRGIESFILIGSREDIIGSKGFFTNISHFIGSVNKVVYYYWPVAMRWKILLPVGWIYFPARRIIRGFIGKRKKINVKYMYDKAADRREVYRRLHLFEVDTPDKK